jgi:Domain of unknown function (DUF3291)
MQYHLAQINIAKFLRPMSDPVNADFVSNLEHVNRLAEEQAGFIWRLIGEGGNATDIQAYEDPNVIINMSVWTDINALGAFVYREPAHRNIMRRRREWFKRMDFFMALWWIPAGYRPTIQEGKQRLDLLSSVGPTEQAFLFNRPFPSPGAKSPEPVLDQCA